MKSATITGDLSMTMANLKSVFLANANIRDNLVMRGAHSKEIKVEKTTEGETTGGQTTKKLEMDSITVGDDIVMCGVTDFNEVDLEAAHIGGTVYMTGVKVGTLEMDLITIDDDLLMRYGSDFKDVDLARAYIGGNLDMTQAEVGKLDMDSIAIGGNLLLRQLPKCKTDSCSNLNLNLQSKHTSEFSEVDLQGAHISGRMSLTGTTLTGELNMDSIFIREDLHMREATFKEDVILTNADIGDELSMSCSTFKKLLNMNSINVGTDLFMNSDKVKKARETNKANKANGKGSDYLCAKEPEFSEITLKNAVIGHNLEIIGAKELVDLDMNSSNIGGSLKLMESSFGAITLQYIQIDKNLDLEDAKITSKIDLTGASIRNVLKLNLDSESFKIDPEKGKIDEDENIALTLHNVKAHAILMPDMWPKTVSFNGFEYQKIENKIDDADVLLGRVLERLDTIKYTPQPYVQFANVLRDMGYKSLATEVIIAKMDKKREHEVGNTLTWLKLSALKFIINYGYGYSYSLVWVLILVASGFFFIRLEQSRKGAKDEQLDDMLEQVFYSINMLLPIIQLNKRHENIEHDISVVRIYFYVHKIMGYVLAMIIVAGLSGMIKPEGF